MLNSNLTWIDLRLNILDLLMVNLLHLDLAWLLHLGIKLADWLLHFYLSFLCFLGFVVNEFCKSKAVGVMRLTVSFSDFVV